MSDLIARPYLTVDENGIVRQNYQDAAYLAILRQDSLETLANLMRAIFREEINAAFEARLQQVQQSKVKLVKKDEPK